MYKDDSLTLHTDLYQINMMQVYFNQGIHNKKAVFEVYFRQLPFKKMCIRDSLPPWLSILRDRFKEVLSWKQFQLD